MFEDAILAIMNASDSSSIYIGCDSVVNKIGPKKYEARYTTVVIVHRDSKHGATIFYHDAYEPDYGNVRQRMLREVSFAIEAAELIAPWRGDKHMEIHLDLNGNPIHKSNAAVREAIGWVRGVTGLQPKIKPHSWAATHAADHCARGKLRR